MRLYRSSSILVPMPFIDLYAYVGHQVHLARALETRTLMRWLGDDLAGKEVLDVAGGDGYWAGQIGRRGATVISLDIDPRRLERGKRFSNRPSLIRGDALRLPFADRSFDVVVSISSIEHFVDGGASIDEMARVVQTGGRVLISTDALTAGHRWPHLVDGHKRRYNVVRPYDHEDLGTLLKARGFEVLDHRYLFKPPAVQRFFIWVSRFRLGWNLMAPFAPIVWLIDKLSRSPGGSIVLIHARRS